MTPNKTSRRTTGPRIPRLGPFTLWLVCCAACPLPHAQAAGPENTARLLATANAMARRANTDRVLGYRAVLTARKRLDVNAFRALRKMSTLYGKAHAPHAQAATIAWSVARHAKNERGTFKARIRLAVVLRKEGDLDAAATLFQSVLEDGVRVAPDAAARALRDLSQDALHQHDLRLMRDLGRRAVSARADPVTQMTVFGRLGQLALHHERAREAERLHARCKQLYERAQGRDPDMARSAAKTWLDLPLRRALRDVR